MKFSFFKAPGRNQYFAAFLANFIALVHGGIGGWLSPALLILNSECTPLVGGPLTPEQVSWLATVICVGGVLGTFISESVTNRFGNRGALIFLALPHFVWWGLVGFGDHYHHLLIGRLVVGLTGGAMYRVLPHYIAEISQKEIRGILGSTMQLMYTTGVLLGFILGEYVAYHLIPLSIIMSVMYIIIIILFIPETPLHLMAKGREQEAYQSLLFYRTVSDSDKVPQFVEDEFSELKKFEKFMHEKSKISWRTFCTKEARFGLSMAVFMSLLIQFTGGYPLMQFTAPIFAESGSSLAPNEAAIVVAVLQIIGTGASFVLIDKVGRKVLLVFSCFGTAISLGTLGTYSYLDKHGVAVSTYNWIPVVSFSAAIFLISIGIMSVAFVVITELMPPEIKETGLTIAMVTNPLIGAGILKAFPILLIEIQVYGIMWIFAGAGVVGMIVLTIFLPETKGKNLIKV